MTKAASDPKLPEAVDIKPKVNTTLACTRWPAFIYQPSK